ISEVGVSMIIGGNIKWHTRTITTAIALETGKGEFGMAIALGLVLLLLAFLVNGSLAVLRKRS
ncbi:MAG TPA: ABC transporter permease, partial [Deltaproteobacteria bacterium]|nr:ABC transporter permease [Deltaproteobacteria bacterium]